MTPQTFGTPVMMSVFLLLATSIDIAHSAPKRPGNTWNACSPSGSQLQGLQQRNPGAMQTCSQMAQQAQSQGKSFAFMCDPSGNVACCDENACVQVGAMIKPKPPGGLRPDLPPAGSFQIPPSPPPGPPGMMPPTGGTQRR